MISISQLKVYLSARTRRLYRDLQIIAGGAFLTQSRYIELLQLSSLENLQLILLTLCEGVSLHRHLTHSFDE
jgi:hypothetical protein